MPDSRVKGLRFKSTCRCQLFFAFADFEIILKKKSQRLQVDLNRRPFTLLSGMLTIQPPGLAHRGGNFERLSIQYTRYNTRSVSNSTSRQSALNKSM